MGAFNDLSDRQFERLNVIKRVGTKSNSPLWLCKCECGNIAEVTSRSLNSGNTKSCGCIHKERLVKRNRNNSKHGDADSRLYGVWHGIKQRCYDPTRKDYPRYGGRGITVCNEWIDNYAAFQQWALKSGYDYHASYMKCTLDRIDTNGPYAPWNCRWIDMKAQSQNRNTENIRRNSDGTYKGVY